MLKDRLVAHRGFQKLYPENTLLSIREAIAAGAHYVELDIQFSADHQPVVYHDLMMKRVSNMEQIVSALPLSELTSLPAYEPQRLGEQFSSERIVPLSSIAELIAKHPKVKLFVEVKPEAAELLGIDKAYQILEETLRPIQQQAILISFHNDFTLHAREQGFPHVGLVVTEWAELAGYPVALDYVFCDKNKLPDNTDLNDLPFLLVVYEVDQPEEARQLFEAGVDMIETFDIKGLLEELGHQAI